MATRVGSERESRSILRISSKSALQRLAYILARSRPIAQKRTGGETAHFGWAQRWPRGHPDSWGRLTNGHSEGRELRALRERDLVTSSTHLSILTFCALNKGNVDCPGDRCSSKLRCFLSSKRRALCYMVCACPGMIVSISASSPAVDENPCSLSEMCALPRPSGCEKKQSAITNEARIVSN